MLCSTYTMLSSSSIAYMTVAWKRGFYECSARCSTAGAKMLLTTSRDKHQRIFWIPDVASEGVIAGALRVLLTAVSEDGQGEDGVCQHWE